MFVCRRAGRKKPDCRNRYSSPVSGLRQPDFGIWNSRRMSGVSMRGDFTTTTFISEYRNFRSAKASFPVECTTDLQKMRIRALQNMLRRKFCAFRSLPAHTVISRWFPAGSAFHRRLLWKRKRLRLQAVPVLCGSPAAQLHTVLRAHGHRPDRWRRKSPH